MRLISSLVKKKNLADSGSKDKGSSESAKSGDSS